MDDRQERATVSDPDRTLARDRPRRREAVREKMELRDATGAGGARSDAPMRYDVAWRDLPIKFVRQDDGAHLSTCGRFRIHKTEHRGFMSTLSGRTRWWVDDLVTARRVYRPSQWGGHVTSLESAVQMLHQLIASGIIDGFAVIADWIKDQRVNAALREQDLARLNETARKIRAWLAQHPTRVVSDSDSIALASELEGVQP
jgi:hypothetical protein